MSERGFKDHFSGHAGDYARYRPHYPASLFRALADRAPGRALAWDVGTGNGQVARGLAAYFGRVHATDASPEQLAAAPAVDRVHFSVETAECCSLDDGSVDLVTVGQALHWFEPDAFHAEVHRVLRPGGLVAAFTYQLCRVTPDVDAVVDELYDDIVGPWWPTERVHVDRGYRDLAFPYQEFDWPEVTLQTRWTIRDYLNYLGTWSSVRRYRADQGEDPLERVRPALLDAWGAEMERDIAWPLAMRAGIRPG